MKNTKKIVICCLLGLSVNLYLGGIQSGIISQGNPIPEERIQAEQAIFPRISVSQAAKLHSPILINGSLELENFCSGNDTDGSIENPHIIENYQIHNPSSDPTLFAGIALLNVDVHVIIRNCIINSSISDNSVGIVGIWVEDCTQVSVSRNIMGNNGWGIKIKDSSFINVSENACFNNTMIGIYLVSTENSTLVENNCSRNGDFELNGRPEDFYIFSTKSGIALIDSQNNRITRNDLVENFCGISLRDSFSNIIWYNNFINSNIQAQTTYSTTGQIHWSKWNNESDGNYWNDYSTRYPLAQYSSTRNIWDTPYELNDICDEFPLIFTYQFTEKNSEDSLSENTKGYLIMFFSSGFAGLTVILIYKKKHNNFF